MSAQKREIANRDAIALAHDDARVDVDINLHFPRGEIDAAHAADLCAEIPHVVVLLQTPDILEGDFRRRAVASAEDVHARDDDGEIHEQGEHRQHEKADDDFGKGVFAFAAHSLSPFIAERNSFTSGCSSFTNSAGGAQAMT